MIPVAGSWCASNLAHGVVEGQAEHLDVEVNGVAGEVAFGPAPVTVFDDETGIGGQNKIARLSRDELESAFFQDLNQWSQSRGTDLLPGPSGFIEWVGHSLFSSGVG